MSDLISRKALLHCFDPNDKENPWTIAARSRIIQQPTAYDPDKVVEQLVEKSFVFKNGSVCIQTLDAIEIVKKGGAEDADI